MRAIINLLIVIEILLLPLPILAAPSIKQTASGAILSRDLSPHMNCYGGGEQFQNLADWSNVNATVKGGCDTFATYNGHLFGVGDQISWCQNTIAGTGSINFSFKYKGPDDTFTPLTADNAGGLAEYCWVATEWALTSCTSGGVFQNHQLGNSQGTHYWDVKLDPNAKSC